MMLTVRFLLLDLLAVAPRVEFFTFLDLFLLQLHSSTTVFFRVLLLEGALSKENCIQDLVPSKLLPAEYRACPH